MKRGEPLSRLGMNIVSTNAYLGADAIAAAYAAGADVIVTGRVTDSALALGPIMATLGWAPDDLDAMACGVLSGHLLECGGQASGGYFAEPGLKDVPDLDRIGFPIAEIRNDRSITITKPPGSGGRIDRHTILEQILYEMHDPAAYITPDVTLDVTALDLAETGRHEVRLRGARGHARPETLKVLIGVDSGVLAEIEISYGGINAEARARLAADIIRKRTARNPMLGNQTIQYDLIGVNSVWPEQGAARCATFACASPRGCRISAPRNNSSPRSRRFMSTGRPAAAVCGFRPGRPAHLHGVRAPGAGDAALAIRRGSIMSQIEFFSISTGRLAAVRFSTRPTLRTYTAFVPRSQVTPRWQWIGAQ